MSRAMKARAPKGAGSMYMLNGVWHVRVSSGSGEARTRPVYSLGTSDRRLANQRRTSLLKKLAAGESLETDAAALAAIPTVASYLDAWTAKRVAQGIVSARDDAQRIRDYAMDAIGSKLIGDVRAADLDAVLDEAVEAGRSKQTVKHLRAALGRMFAAAWRAEIIPENPIKRVILPKMREQRKQRVILHDHEFEVLMSYLGERCAALDRREQKTGKPNRRSGDLELRVMCACARVLGGMRTSDVNRWDYSAWDLVHFAKVIVPRTKTDAPQELQVPVGLRPILRDWWERSGCPTSGPVFPATRGANAGGFKAERGISYAARLRRACKAAGLDRPELYVDTARTRRVDFHSFRRAFAGAMANAPGISTQLSMKLTGHTDLRTHQRYVAQPTEIPAAALPRLPAGDDAPPAGLLFEAGEALVTASPDGEARCSAGFDGSGPDSGEAAGCDEGAGLATACGQSSADPSNSARHTRFERVTFGSGGRRSIQLS